MFMLKIPGELLEFGESFARRPGTGASRLVEAIVNVVMDIELFGFSDGLLNRVELLGNFEASAAAFDHRDDGAKMTLGPFQAVNDRGVSAVRHGPYPIPLEGIKKDYARVVRPGTR